MDAKLNGVISQKAVNFNAYFFCTFFYHFSKSRRSGNRSGYKRIFVIFNFCKESHVTSIYCVIRPVYRKYVAFTHKCLSIFFFFFQFLISEINVDPRQENVAFYGTRGFVTSFTGDRFLYLPRTR
jgi:hypothetical protein